MEVEFLSDAPRPSEQEVRISGASSTGDLATIAIVDPFAPKSVMKSTEIALQSIAGSLKDLPSEEKEESDDTTLEHDEVGLNLIEDDDVLKKILKDANTGFCDNNIESCLSSSTIPEELIESMLCKADRTLCTCETTDWIEKATGYNLCADKENLALDGDDDTKSTMSMDRSLASEENMSIASGSQPNSLPNSTTESNESAMPECKVETEEMDDDDSGLECVQREAASEQEKDEEAITVPVSEPVVEPVTEPVVEPVTEPVVEPVTEPVIEPVTEPVTEPVIEPVTEPVTEPVIEPVTAPVTAPAVIEPAVTAAPFTVPEFAEC